MSRNGGYKFQKQARNSMQHVNASAGWLMNFKNDAPLRNLCAVSTAENKFFHGDTLSS